MTTKSSFPCTVLLLLTMFSSGIGAASYQLDGVWAYEGYGRILEVDSDAVNIFAVTRSDCVLLERISRDEYLHRIDRMNLSEKVCAVSTYGSDLGLV